MCLLFHIGETAKICRKIEENMTIRALKAPKQNSMFCVICDFRNNDSTNIVTAYNYTAGLLTNYHLRNSDLSG